MTEAILTVIAISFATMAVAATFTIAAIAVETVFDVLGRWR